MAEFKFTKLAELDLVDIHEEIFPVNKEGALRLLNAIEMRCKGLAEMPNSGRNRHELFPDMQSVAEGNYTIYFKATDYGILVIRILHCKQETDRFFLPGALPSELA